MAHDFSEPIAEYKVAKQIVALDPGVGEDDPLTSPPATGEERNWLQNLTHSLDGFTKSAEARIQSRVQEDKDWALRLAKQVVVTAKAMDWYMNQFAGESKHELAQIVRRANALGTFGFGGMSALLWAGLALLLILGLKKD